MAFVYRNANTMPTPPFLLAIFLYVQIGTLLIFAYLREFLRELRQMMVKFSPDASMENPKMLDFVPLYSGFDSLYTRYFYGRARDCVNRPLQSTAGRLIEVIERRNLPNLLPTGLTQRNVINFGSYNYLGFSENIGQSAIKSVEAIDRNSVGVCSSRTELGTLAIHKKLEETVAKFLGVQDAICFAMGFVTNSANLACLVDEKSLILSDELNHSSIVVGCKLSKATLQTFEHNNVYDLELKLRRAISYGRMFRSGRSSMPYNKILICIEGVYSMEGTIANLPKIIALKKKYKAYLYVDEAHSIGALGKSGKGICDYFGVDPRDVDLLMGTFTKSFGSVGGYIGGQKKVIDHLRASSPASHYGSSLSAPCAQQVITSMEIILDKKNADGRRRIDTLAWNTRYFHTSLRNLGLQTFGHKDSPVITLPVYFMTKIVYISRALLAKNIAVVAVAFPATPIISARIRFCLSASHTKQDLDQCLDVLKDLGRVVGLGAYVRRLEIQDGPF